jgi:hypothetical protein
VAGGSVPMSAHCSGNLAECEMEARIWLHSEEFGSTATASITLKRFMISVQVPVRSKLPDISATLGKEMPESTRGYYGHRASVPTPFQCRIFTG